MSTRRELPFHCTFTSPLGRAQAVVLAWDPAEAGAAFRRFLDEDQLRHGGVLEVATGAGRVALRERLRPLPRSARA